MRKTIHRRRVPEPQRSESSDRRNLHPRRAVSLNIVLIHRKSLNGEQASNREGILLTGTRAERSETDHDTANLPHRFDPGKMKLPEFVPR